MYVKGEMPHAIKVDLLDHILNAETQPPREIDDAEAARTTCKKEVSPPMDIFVQLTYTKTRVKVKLNTAS